jgi:hypothetical protein
MQGSRLLGLVVNVARAAGVINIGPGEISLGQLQTWKPPYIFAKLAARFKSHTEVSTLGA